MSDNHFETYSHFQFGIHFLAMTRKCILEGTHYNGRNGAFRRLDYPITWQLFNIGNDYLPILSTRKMNFDCWVTEFCWDWNGDRIIANLGKYAYLWETWAENGIYDYSYGRIWRDPFFHCPDYQSGPLDGENNNNCSDYDQIARVVDTLFIAAKTGTISRRAVISTWDIVAITPWKSKAVVPPCHPFLNFVQNHQKQISLYITSRSQDLLVGFPGDVIRYALMLKTVVQLVNNRICSECQEVTEFSEGSLIFKFEDLHVYEEHIPIFLEKEFGSLGTLDKNSSPKVTASLEDCGVNTWLTSSNFVLEDYVPGPKVIYGLIP